jgi:hypothetical protein
VHETRRGLLAGASVAVVGAAKQTPRSFQRKQTEDLCAPESIVEDGDAHAGGWLGGVAAAAAKATEGAQTPDDEK